MGRRDTVLYGINSDSMEAAADKRLRHDPVGMRYVQRLGYHSIVQSPMDSVNAQILEASEYWRSHEVVESKGSIWQSIIEFLIATNLKQEKERGTYYHWRALRSWGGKPQA